MTFDPLKQGEMKDALEPLSLREAMIGPVPSHEAIALMDLRISWLSRRHSLVCGVLKPLVGRDPSINV